MRNWILAAGAATLAFTAPALADPHGGKGQGKANGGQQMKADHGGRGGQHGDAGSMKAMKQDHGGRGQVSMRADRGKPDKAGPVHAQGPGPNKSERRVEANVARGNGKVKMAGNDPVIIRRDFDGSSFFRNGRVSLDCPPGLDRKNNGCVPPGQAMKMVGSPLIAAFANDRIPYQYRSWYPDNDNYFYRTGDGFIYRVNRSNDLVDGLIPLFGSGYYAVGDPWPQPYNFYNVPYQYRSYWPDNGDYLYRYGDGAIYRLDPQTNAVNAIVALLAGDLGVGSRLPVGYDAYNVPFAYRDRYYDTADAWYRYNDGYIYRVDPTTRLITAVIDALV